jgi:tetratricopeptide (TPR) repeat protein
MQPLEPPDTHFLSSTIGWMELGNLEEAEAEYGHVSPETRKHPDAIEVLWMLRAQGQRWDEALLAATALVKAAPDRASGWLHQSYALRRSTHGGLQQAMDALLPAADRFPTEPVIFYNISCYTCQMGQLAEATTWLNRAIAVAGLPKIKEMALADHDLQPLWNEIKKM